MSRDARVRCRRSSPTSFPLSFTEAFVTSRLRGSARARIGHSS